MQELKLKVKRVVVVQRRNHPDRISLEFEATSSFPDMNYPPFALFDCAADYGVQWCCTAIRKKAKSAPEDEALLFAAGETLRLEPDEVISSNL